MHKIPMNRYQLVVNGSSDVSQLILYSPIDDEREIKKRFTHVLGIIKKEGYIDDESKGEPLFEFKLFGNSEFRDRDSALRCLEDLLFDRDRKSIVYLMHHLEQNPQLDITQYGYTLHYWHSSNKNMYSEPYIPL